MKETCKKFLKDPIIAAVADTKEVFWENPKVLPFEEAAKKLPVTTEGIDDAEARLKRFEPFIVKVFPETKDSGGMIESPLREIPRMLEKLRTYAEIPGDMYLKMDSHLQVAGSIKARGGIYEVLKHTEELALEHGLLKEGDSYDVLASEKCREFFGDYKIQVGSTGNLGLSIGIASAAIGYQVVVHMSTDAKQWKKDLLREKGVTVKEYESDYSLAVKEGRKLSDEDPKSYFVDDENSVDLFMGYAVAARRLKRQLEKEGIRPTEQRPLFLYLPCGVGGAPGGVAYGCKAIFKEKVRIYFVEPTHAPCMLLGMATGLHEKVSVQDFGIDGKTIADGLAVGRPSGFVGGVMDYIIDGIFTVKDEKLLPLMALLYDSEEIIIEPSACSAFAGPMFLYSDMAKEYREKTGIGEGVHIPWATGGALVPDEITRREVAQGRKALQYDVL